MRLGKMSSYVAQGRVLLAAAVLACGSAAAQPPAPPAAPVHRGGLDTHPGPIFADPAKADAMMRGEMSARAFPTPVADDTSSFPSLFDGKTLDGWESLPGYWRVENGMIVGESTVEHPVKDNVFLLLKGPPVGDFDMVMEWKISPGEEANSGIIYRAKMLNPPNRIIGYQADIDYIGLYGGNLHLEGGAARCPPCQLSPKGQFARMDEKGAIRLAGSISEVPTLKGVLNPGGWNTYRLIVRDRIHILVVNGVVSSIFMSDEPTPEWPRQGLLGLQLHQGPPMKITIRKIAMRRF